MGDDETGLVLGMDIGATSSRCVVADLFGRIVGSGQAGGGNPNSHTPEQAAHEVCAAARAALSGIDASAVRAGILGMAGVSAMSDPAVAAPFEQAWSSLGLTFSIIMLSDCEVAFAAGTPNPAGTVLIAGTGAIAARIDQHRLARTVGGHGWLLGDEGSAFWLGREAAREAMRALDRREPHRDGLIASVLGELTRSRGEPDDLRRQVIVAVHSAEPIRLAELAPLVTSAARSGDKRAIDIVHRAAILLADTVQAARPPADGTPIVLAGSLTAAGNPVGDALRAELTARSANGLHTAGHGAVGAAWLAALPLVGSNAAEIHARLLRPDPQY